MHLTFTCFSWVNVAAVTASWLFLHCRISTTYPHEWKKKKERVCTNRACVKRFKRWVRLDWRHWTTSDNHPQEKYHASWGGREGEGKRHSRAKWIVVLLRVVSVGLAKEDWFPGNKESHAELFKPKYVFTLQRPEYIQPWQFGGIYLNMSLSSGIALNAPHHPVTVQHSSPAEVIKHINTFPTMWLIYLFVDTVRREH